MPRPDLPPTPQSSVDLFPKPPPSLSSLELAFKLPPPALGSIAASTSTPPPKPPYDISSPPSSNSSSSNYPVISPTSQSDATKKAPNEAASQQAKKRRRSTLEALKSQNSPAQKPTTSTEAITLPPPPTRNRKIIQMKPRQPSAPSASSNPQQPSSAPEPKTKSKKTAGSKSDKTTEDGKPSAVGRKIARKTAHSLIERRRRFKMNEEFGVLKGMIPACTGVEMHKLAILQASIEYLKYLEQCVSDLKASGSVATHQNKVPTFPPGGYDEDEVEEEDEENDEEMVDIESAPQEQLADTLPSSEESSTKTTQTEELTPTYSTFHTPSGLVSPCSHSTRSQYSPAHSQCSPSYFTPQALSTTTSPNLYPQQYPSSEHGHDQVDTEATHALLLLADVSRRRSSETARDTGPEKKGRGMSVKDLLSS